MRTQAGRNMTVVTGLIFVLALCGASYASPVKAEAGDSQTQTKDVAVMVPPRTEAGIPPAMGERAVGVVARALKSDHFSVIEPAQAVAIAESMQAEAGGGQAPEDSDLNQCTTTDCAIWYRALLNAAVAVQMTLFTKVGPAARSNQLDSVTLVIVQRANVQFSGSATVRDGDVETAVLEAYRAAREKQIKGVGPWLTVRGEPQGAQILLDGQLWGPLPHKDAVEPGMHAVIVRKNGYEESNQSVNVGDYSDSEAVLEVRLKLATGAATATSVATTDASPTENASRPFFQSNVWDYAVGGSLAAIGVVHVVRYVMVRGHDDGECAERGPNGCTEVYESSGSDAKVLLGLGVGGILAGAAVIALGPIGRLSAQADSQSAKLTLQGAF